MSAALGVNSPSAAEILDPYADLRGALVLVVGARQGIGAAIRDAFVGVGARVIAADLGWDEEEPRADERGFHRVHVDVSEESSVEALLTRIEADFGVVRVLVDSAGLSTMDRVVETRSADWDLNQAVNARGSFLLGRGVASRLEAAGLPGRIIFIASQAGKNGYRCMGAYVASKHAVLGLTKTLAIEEAPHGITVNAVCPGIIETSMKARERVEGGALRGMTAAEVEAEDNSQVPLGRTGQPEDVAAVCLFLASRLGSYLTGQGINVTGGMTMH